MLFVNMDVITDDKHTYNLYNLAAATPNTYDVMSCETLYLLTDLQNKLSPHSIIAVEGDKVILITIQDQYYLFTNNCCGELLDANDVRLIKQNAK